MAGRVFNVSPVSVVKRPSGFSKGLCFFSKKSDGSNCESNVMRKTGLGRAGWFKPDGSLLTWKPSVYKKPKSQLKVHFHFQSFWPHLLDFISRWTLLSCHRLQVIKVWNKSSMTTEQTLSADEGCVIRLRAQNKWVGGPWVERIKIASFLAWTEGSR